MVAGDPRVSSNKFQTDPTVMSEDDRARQLEEREQAEAAQRDTALTDAISGNMSAEDLENMRQGILAEKRELQGEFNRYHSDVVVPLGNEYSRALGDRAKKGWNKLNKFNIWEGSQKLFNNFSTAYTNLTTTGRLGDVSLPWINVDQTDIQGMTSYVSGQQQYYAEMSSVDERTYLEAQAEFRAANDYSYQVEGDLGKGIDKERAMVEDMRLLDGRLRNVTIAQNMMDYMG